MARTLSLADRRTLLAKLSSDLLGPGSGETRDVDMWASSLQDALVRLDGSRSRGRVGPANLKRTLGAGSSWSYVADFMAASQLAKLNVSERCAAYSLLADLVVARAQEVANFAGIPVSTKLVVNQVPGIAALFDAAFPGYVRAGLARVVITRRIS